MPFIKPIFRALSWDGMPLTGVILKLLSLCRQKVILPGDSLVDSLSRYPSVWDHYIQLLNAVNCGIGGDRI